MDYVLAAIVGVGLAAACGLRAFVPILGLALAAKAGWVTLGPSFEWLASWPAIAALSVATVAEVVSSLTPIVAHALDAVAAPIACGAGALVMASQWSGPIAGLAGSPDLTHVHPMLEWSAALIAGAGVATAVHAGSASLRAGTSAASASLLAPVYGALETIASVIASIMALVVPVVFAVLAGAILAVATVLGVWFVRRTLARRRAQLQLA